MKIVKTLYKKIIIEQNMSRIQKIFKKNKH